MSENQEFVTLRKVNLETATPAFAYRGILLFETSSVCPEQYDAKDSSGLQIGYLRLSGGIFRVDVPNCGGTTILRAAPKGDGSFEVGEREGFFTAAIDAILENQG